VVGSTPSTRADVHSADHHFVNSRRNVDHSAGSATARGIPPRRSSR